MVSRRELIGKAAVGATAALALGAAGASARALRSATGDSGDGPGIGQPAAEQPAAPEAAALPAPWELVSPLAAGAVVAHAWRLADLSPVQDGSCVVTLQNDAGRAHRVHVCRNDGSPQGIVHTRRLDLVMMNAGQGDLPTEESLARAIAALGRVVAANESTMPDGVLAGLLPHAERVQRFASADGTPLGGKLR